jgi:hypothetical protein
MLMRLSVILVLGFQALAAQGSKLPADVAQDAEAEFKSAVRGGLRPSEAYSASVFVLNHEEIAIPLLLQEVRAKLGDKGAVEFITRATELIAYAASDRGMDAVADLCSLDEKRFSPLVGRLLDHAINREREYEIAYYAFENHPNLREIVGRWVEESLSFSQADLALAKELVKRENSGLAVLEDDPLLSPLPVVAKERIKAAVEKVRTEDRRRKGQP